MIQWLNKCHFGDVREVLQRMIADGVKVNTIVTSPPYWGLRSYLPADHPLKAKEIGSEPTLAEFLAVMVYVFELCRQVLADDGTMWVNMGDSYCSTDKWGGGKNGNTGKQTVADDGAVPSWDAVRERKQAQAGFKPKNLMGQPWRLAFALQDAGWYLRQDIIWSKPNPMPESTRDRCTKAHEYIFLLSKNPRYYYDFDAVREQVSGTANPRRAKGYISPSGWNTGEGGHGSFHPDGREKGVYEGVGQRQGPPGNPAPRLAGNVNPPKGQKAYEAGDDKQRTKAGLLAYAEKTRKLAEAGSGIKNNTSYESVSAGDLVDSRNRRSVWTVPSEPYSGAHFATFPTELVRHPILAGCPEGGTVLDIFFGSGTTGQVAASLGRNWIGIDLDERNHALQQERLATPLQRLAQRGLDLRSDDNEIPAFDAVHPGGDKERREHVQAGIPGLGGE